MNTGFPLPVTHPPKAPRIDGFLILQVREQAQRVLQVLPPHSQLEPRPEPQTCCWPHRIPVWAATSPRPIFGPSSAPNANTLSK